MDYLNVEGKSAIVTGAAQGIGEGIATRFAEFGINVTVCDINDSLGKEVVERINSNGGKAIYCHCNVTDVKEVEQVVKCTIDTFGAVDIVVNNAGIGSNCHPVEELSDDEWNQMMNVDVKSVFNFTRAVVPHMKKRKYGKIVNISSGGGVGGMMNLSHYSAAKAALFGFTKSVAREVAPFNINVNCIATPTTQTPATTAYDYDDDLDAELRLIPMGRIAQPKDIADMALYLVCDSSEYVTGQVMAPNGGKR